MQGVYYHTSQPRRRWWPFEVVPERIAVFIMSDAVEPFGVIKQTHDCHCELLVAKKELRRCLRRLIEDDVNCSARKNVCRRLGYALFIMLQLLLQKGAIHKLRDQGIRSVIDVAPYPFLQATLGSSIYVAVCSTNKTCSAQ